MDKALVERFARFNRSLATACERVALAALVFMVIVTCIDAAGAKLLLKPLRGSLDMMMMAQLVGVCFAGAATLIEGRHIAVDFFVALLPERPRAALAAAVHLAALVLFAIVAWQLFEHGAELQRSREVTPTAAIPIAPFAYAAALSMVPFCLVLAQQFLESVAGMRETRA